MNVLIVGKNSYIGRSVGNWFSNKENAPKIEYISVRDDSWKTMDMTGYDVVIFAAAIVHRKDVDSWELYEQVNSKLPYSFAQRAKEYGVKQFVFISTAGVYQADKSLPVGDIIGDQTPLLPSSMYGKSKLLGEKLISSLEDSAFHVSIIRPMNVYGKGCSGNYIPLFVKIAKMLPVLPNAFSSVKQGMIYIDNLSELCWLAANSNVSGTYLAQDRESVSSYEIMSAITEGLHLKKYSIRCTWLFNLVRWFSPVKKLFGGVAYSREAAQCALGDYQLVGLAEGISRMVTC